LIYRRRPSSILDIGSFTAADSDTDHYLVVANVSGTQRVRKQTTHRVHTERINVKQLNEAEGKEEYHVKISNSLAAMGNRLRCVLSEFVK
jgi:hypothetical protein